MAFWKSFGDLVVKELQDYFKPAVIEALRVVEVEIRLRKGESISDDLLYRIYRDANMVARKKLTTKKV